MCLVGAVGHPSTHVGHIFGSRIDPTTQSVVRSDPICTHPLLCSRRHGPVSLPNLNSHKPHDSGQRLGRGGNFVCHGGLQNFGSNVSRAVIMINTSSEPRRCPTHVFRLNVGSLSYSFGLFGRASHSPSFELHRALMCLFILDVPASIRPPSHWPVPLRSTTDAHTLLCGIGIACIDIPPRSTHAADLDAVDPSLLSLLAPTILPLSHSPSIVEWSVRCIRSITLPMPFTKSANAAGTGAGATEEWMSHAKGIEREWRVWYWRRDCYGINSKDRLRSSVGVRVTPAEPVSVDAPLQASAALGSGGLNHRT
ncbi:hypothetical protein B0H13DRAFT_2666025 [Mycena leptocephala]|nr:hypothetical protein B0H13DRAFT_2688488 [Mycena leptocephala]KAJ7811028.1 hypothetical protein B0H13DRAFT_2685338 [Mycena leptocephala]KAJ7890248.1 hypothetical protein B0H13DRAFT_2666025 [Mycena leptocephala]